jgi:hypothetical protein
MAAQSLERKESSYFRRLLPKLFEICSRFFIISAVLEFWRRVWHCRLRAPLDLPATDKPMGTNEKGPLAKQTDAEAPAIGDRLTAIIQMVFNCQSFVDESAQSDEHELEELCAQKFSCGLAGVTTLFAKATAKLVDATGLASN